MTVDKAFDGIMPQERQFTKVQDADMYHEICRTLPLARFAQVRRGKVHTCCTGESQTQLRPSPLQCTFHRGRGRVTWGGQPVGNIVSGGSWFRRHRLLEFQVNGTPVLTMKVHDMTWDKPCQYLIRLAGEPALHMATPKWIEKRELYMLRYRLLSTKKVGIESCKNFGLCNEQEETVLECLKDGGDTLLMAAQPPFNVVLAAVVGFMRFYA